MNTSIYKQDFITYCRDLCKVTSGFLDMHWLHDQQEMSFSEILDEYLEVNPACLTSLKKMDCCVIAHDGIEYNPMHAHVGTYLINRYSLQCDVFDVIGDGATPALQVADHLIKMYFAVQKIKSAVVLEFGRSQLELHYIW